MYNIQTGAERMPYDLSHLGFLACQIGRLITISTTPVVRGDSFFFFFQAEDGIRDLTVTGVQTCALPIFGHDRGLAAEDQVVVRVRARARRVGDCVALGEAVVVEGVAAAEGALAVADREDRKSVV